MFLMYHHIRPIDHLKKREVLMTIVTPMIPRSNPRPQNPYGAPIQIPKPNPGK
jgi:hypothetical protein